MDLLKKIKSDLAEFIEPEKAEFLPKFFKAFPGGYGEGDKFIGVRVPYQRKVAKRHFRDFALKSFGVVLQSDVHEYRLTGLFMLGYRFEKTTTEADRKNIIDLYLANLKGVNNWDLVDYSADRILGLYLKDKSKSMLYNFARDKDLWKNRIAIVSTFPCIKDNKFQDTIKISEILIHHPHDLIHKAVGWMLREVGNRNLNSEITFLEKHSKTMPRTMLRYAIEKFDEELRQKFLKK